MMQKVRYFMELTKPRQTALLLVTMAGAYLIAAKSIDVIMLAKLLIMGFTAIGGVTALNMYLDRDIDAIMKRTSSRPLPRGRLSFDEVMIGILVMLLIGITIASTINRYVLFAVLAGLYFDIVGYTELTKRFTPASIILGSIAGSMPALGGWAAGAGEISLPGILLAGVVYAWQPLHVWFLAYAAEEDYRKAGVPVASLRTDHKTFSILVVAHLAIMIVAIWGISWTIGAGLLTASISSVFVLLAIARVLYFYKSPSKTEALRIFKFASPTLAIVYLMMPIEIAVLQYLR